MGSAVGSEVGLSFSERDQVVPVSRAQGRSPRPPDHRLQVALRSEHMHNASVIHYTLCRVTFFALVGLMTVSTFAAVEIRLVDAASGEATASLAPGEDVRLRLEASPGASGDRVGGIYCRVTLPTPSTARLTGKPYSQIASKARAGESQNAVPWQLVSRNYGIYGWHENDGFWDLSVPRPGLDTFPVEVNAALIPGTGEADFTFSSVRADLTALPAQGTHTVEEFVLRIPEDFPRGYYPLVLEDIEVSTIEGTLLPVAQQGVSFLVGVGTPTFLTVHLSKGWNLVALNGIPRDSRPGAVFGEEAVQPVFEWQEKGRGSPMFTVAGPIQELTPYWVRSDSEYTAQVEGLAAMPGQTFELREGWNLVAVPRSSALPSEPLLGGPAYAWQGSANETGVYQPVQHLDPGRGYWIYWSGPSAQVDFPPSRQVVVPLPRAR